MSHSMRIIKTFTPIRAMCVLGSRPDCLKIAPIIRRMKAEPDAFQVHVVLAGQHPNLLRQAVRVFDIVPNGDVDCSGASPNARVAGLLGGLDAEIARFRPEVVIAHGESSSALASALTCHHRRVRFVHVGAGIRGRRADANGARRSMNSLLADLHCAPTAAAHAALLAEQVPAEQVLLSGDTAMDSLLDTLRRPLGLPLVIAPKQRMALLSLHRRDVSGAPAERVFKIIRQLSVHNPDVDFVHPLHARSDVRRAAYNTLMGFENVRLIEPIDYPEFVALMGRSSLILTDSIGVQEAALMLGVPLLALRHQHPSAERSGPADPKADPIFVAAQEALNTPRSNRPREVRTHPYGDGCSAQRIVHEIWRRYRLQRFDAASRQCARAEAEPRSSKMRAAR